MYDKGSYLGKNIVKLRTNPLIFITVPVLFMTKPMIFRTTPGIIRKHLFLLGHPGGRPQHEV